MKDRAFALKIALFNSVGFCATVAGETYVDARLLGSRAVVHHYGYWLCVAGPFILGLTFLCIARSSSGRIRSYGPAIILAIAGVLSLPALWPESAVGTVVWVGQMVTLSLFSCWTYFMPTRRDWLTSPHVERQIKIERVKAMYEFWRSLAVTLGFSYLALLLSEGGLVVAAAPSVVPLNAVGRFVRCETLGIVYISFYVLFGVGFVVYRKVNEVGDLLLGID